MNAKNSAGDARVVSVDGHDIAIRLHRPGGKGKTGVLVFLGGQPEELALMAAAARCLVLSVEANASVKVGQHVLDWVRSCARELGADPSRLAIGGAGTDAGAAIAIAQMAHGAPLALLLLVSPCFALEGIKPEQLPSTFVEAEATSETRAVILDFITALLEADVEAQLHLAAAPGAAIGATESDRVLRIALRADALKRALGK